MRPPSAHAMSDRASFLSDLLSCLVLLGGIITGVVSVHMVISTYSSLPYWDEWGLVDRLATGQPFSLAWLWAQHNEHRIPFSKLFFQADIRLVHGNQILLLASIFFITVLHVVLLSWSLRSLGGMRGAAWRIGTGLVAFLLLSPIQQENLVWGFQLSFVLPTAMATLATLALLLHHSSNRKGGRRGLMFLLLSIAAASVATFSLANGMLLWPVLILAAVLVQTSYSTTVALVLAAAVNIGGYFYHYHLPSQAGPRVSVHNFFQVLEYIALYFGSTWIHHATVYVPIAIGIVALAGAVAIVTRVLLRRDTRSLLMVQLSLLLLFCMGTAMVTAFGRLRFGIEQAGSSRYQVFTLLFWCALGLSVFCGTNTHQANNRNLTRFSGLVLLVMAGAATQARYPIRDARWHKVRLQAISNALLADVRDPEQLVLAFPNAKLVTRDAEYLRRNRLSIFAEEPFSQLGQPLERFYQLRAAEQCSGYIGNWESLPTASSLGLRVSGYAWNHSLRAPVRQVVFASEGRIQGFGSSVTIPMKSVKPGPDADAKRFGWLGYVGGIAPHDKVEVYAVLADSVSVCPVVAIYQ